MSYAKKAALWQGSGMLGLAVIALFFEVSPVMHLVLPTASLLLSGFSFFYWLRRDRREPPSMGSATVRPATGEHA